MYLPSPVVFNTLNWQRSGLINVYIDHDVLPLDKEFKIIDDKGRNLAAHPHQK